MKASGSNFKTLNRAFGKALHDYDMIREGDRIAVGLSGGADSLTLLALLAERRHRVPVHYALTAVYVDLGFGAASAAATLRSFCDRHEVPLQVEWTDFGVVSHSPLNRENPCFLCARRRRQRLFEVADRLGCNKLALGHNKDDLVATLFLNICYAGEISTMLPSQNLFQGRFTVLRPLAYAERERIRRFTRDQGFEIVVNACPTSKRSKRDDIQRMLLDLYRTNPKIRGNIFRAMHNVRPDYLPAKLPRGKSRRGARLAVRRSKTAAA